MNNLYQCKICGEFIKKGNGHHVKKCIDTYIQNLQAKEIDKIKDLYLIQEKSIQDVANIYHLDRSTMQNILKRLNIPLRNIKEATKTSTCRNKYKQTCLEHFGTEHNFSKNCPSRKQWENRLLETEGITNVFQRQTVKDKIKKTLYTNFGENAHNVINSKEHYIQKYIAQGYTFEEANNKYKDICYKRGNLMRLSFYLEKYGGNAEEIYKKYVKKVRNNKPYTISKLNKKIYNLLDSLNIVYTPEFCIGLDNIFHNKDIKKRYNLYYDIKLNNNFLIEINGDYWHANPNIYKKSDIINYPNNQHIAAETVWKCDLFKKEYAELQGYQVIYLWESDINNPEKFNIIKNAFQRYGEIENSENRKNANT